MSIIRRNNNKNNKLRMDISSIQPQLHSGGFSKRKEFDSMMRKARESHSSYWNKRLLEVEERDPNRWRHSGYKELYVGSHSVADPRNHIRSPKYRTSPLRSSRIYSPYFLQNRSLRVKNSRSPRQKSPGISSFYSSHDRSPRKKNSSSPRLKSPQNRESIISNSRSPKAKNPILSFQKFRNHSKLKKKSSTESNCSDKSCSVCSPKHCFNKKVKPRLKLRTEHINLKDTPFKKTLSTSLKTMSHNFMQTPDATSYQQIIKERKLMGTNRKMKDLQIVSEDKKLSSDSVEMQLPVKIEKSQSGFEEKRYKTAPSPSEDSDSSSNNSQLVTPRMTLSERFGKMAQWNVDRRDMENMKITKVGSNITKVLIEGEEKISLGYVSPPPGHYPESLPLQGPRGLDCWDDVRVRYSYYKSRGYLRDLRLEDYIKWEEWWYKYQEWLETERYYEKWALHASNRLNTVNRKRRGRKPIIH